MAARTEIIDDKIITAIEDVIRKRMARFGFRRARVRPGLDWTGEPTLYIDAEYDLVKEPLELGVTYGLEVDLMDALEAVGEFRFPHLRHHFDERQTTTADK